MGPVIKDGNIKGKENEEKRLDGTMGAALRSALWGMKSGTARTTFAQLSVVLLTSPS